MSTTAAIDAAIVTMQQSCVWCSTQLSAAYWLSSLPLLTLLKAAGLAACKTLACKKLRSLPVGYLVQRAI